MMITMISPAPEAASLLAVNDAGLLDGEIVLICGADSTTMPGTARLSRAEALEVSAIALLTVALTAALAVAVLERMLKVMTTLALLICTLIASGLTPHADAMDSASADRVASS